MSEEVKNKLIYRVMKVEKTAAPEGLEGDNWHRYVVGHGNSKIEGKKTGTLEDVTQHAEVFAEDLNSRMRGGSTYASRKKS